MRLWRIRQELLLDRGPTAETIPSWLFSEVSWPFSTPPSDFTLIDAAGNKLEHFYSLCWSLEDELGASLLSVDHSQLVKLRISQRAHAFHVEREIVLDGLTPVDDAESHQRAETFLQAEAAARRARANEGQARVDAIRGAREPQGFGADFDIAQRMLMARLASFDEPVSAQLLRALLAFGQLYEMDPKLERALGSLIWACRRAAFDRTLPWDSATCSVNEVLSLKGFRGLNQAGQEDGQRLAKELDALVIALRAEADSQEAVDANQNAAAFSTAADAVRRARDELVDVIRAR